MSMFNKCLGIQCSIKLISSRKFHLQNRKLFMFKQNQSSFGMRNFSSILDDSSWAAEGLQKKGEKLAPAPIEPLVVVEDIRTHPPSIKVKELVHQILTLNVVEIQQLLNILQVLLSFILTFVLYSKIFN